jgi:hypothetical protein
MIGTHGIVLAYASFLHLRIAFGQRQLGPSHVGLRTSGDRQHIVFSLVGG